MDNLLPTLFTPVSGAWTSLVLALAVASLLLGDQILARLAQHILVGGLLGYAAVITMRSVLLPRFASALTGADPLWAGWLPLGLGLLLWAAGVDYLRAQGKSTTTPLPGWRRWLRRLGLLPTMLMLGVGVTVALLGVLQGTLLPQIWQVGRTAAAAGDFAGWQTLLVTLLTTAVLVQITGQQAQLGETWPTPLRALLALWRWIGARALWLAAGLLFARLVATRLSLLIGWGEMILQKLATIGFD